jgi:histone chaperone ASF1
MAQVHINNIVVDNNPAPILAPFKFHITFECFTPLPGTFDWKIIYIGSPENSHYDQVVDSFDMDNLQAGVMQFTVDSSPPNFSLIPPEEIIGTPRTIQARLR